MVEYFAESSSADAAYAIYFLMGHKLKPTFPTRIIRLAAARSAQIPDWLFEETYQWVGDLAETAASMARGMSSGNPETLSQTVEQRLIPLLHLAGPSKRKPRTSASQYDAKAPDDDSLAIALIETWSRYDSTERFVFNKLLTGNLRVGVSAKLVTKALGHWCGLPTDELTHRLMGHWEPNEAFLNALKTLPLLLSPWVTGRLFAKPLRQRLHRRVEVGWDPSSIDPTFRKQFPLVQRRGNA
jgi:DNA ligase-1